MEAVAYANMRLGALGMDSVSCGATIAWAMECVQKGLIPKEDLEGLDLGFGKLETWLQVIELIAHRKGIGNTLAEGSYRAGQKYGDEAVALAPVVKKQELPAHEPRVKHGLGLGYMVSPTGADHMHNFHDTGYTKRTTSIQPLGIFKPLPPPAGTAASLSWSRWASGSIRAAACSTSGRASTTRPISWLGAS